MINFMMKNTKIIICNDFTQAWWSWSVVYENNCVVLMFWWVSICGVVVKPSWLIPVALRRKWKVHLYCQHSQIFLIIHLILLMNNSYTELLSEKWTNLLCSWNSRKSYHWCSQPIFMSVIRKKGSQPVLMITVVVFEQLFWLLVILSGVGTPRQSDVVRHRNICSHFRRSQKRNEPGKPVMLILIKVCSGRIVTLIVMSMLKI